MLYFKQSTIKNNSKRLNELEIKNNDIIILDVINFPNESFIIPHADNIPVTEMFATDTTFQMKLAANYPALAAALDSSN